MSDFTFTFHFPALEKEMATHSSLRAWRVPGTGGPGGLPSMGLRPEVPASPRDEAPFHFTKPSGVPRGLSQLHSTCHRATEPVYHKY